MANKIYECKFSSEKGENYIFELWDLAFTGHALTWGTGTPHQLDIAKGGIDIKYSGDPDNPLSPITTSTCSVDLVIRNSKQQRIIEQLPSAHDYQIACKIYRVIDGNSEPFWYGLLAPEQVVTDIGPWPIGCSLTFTDGIAFLRDVELSDDDGQRLNRGYHLRGYVGYCLSKLPHFSIFWGELDEIFYSMTDLYHTDHEDSGTIYDPLRYSAIHSDVFYVEREAQNPFGRGFYTKETRATAYDVLEDIMIAFGLRFMHSAGAFYAYSPVPLRGSASVSDIRYKNDRRAMQPGSGFDFSESEADNVSSTINIEHDLSAAYTVEAGSKRTFLPPLKRALLTHKNGGSQRIFPNTDIFYVDWKWYSGDNNFIQRPPLSILGPFSPNVPIDVFNPDAPTAMFGPVEVNSDDFDLVIPEGLGFTLVGTMEATFWSPDMSDSNPADYFVGGRSNEMLGAKPVVRMKLRVGNYYLKQTLRQTTSADFPTNSVMQNQNWGRVNIGATQIGVPAADREFFPLVVDDLAQWTTDSSDTFDFALIQPGLVGIGASGDPDNFIDVPTIAYRDVNADGDVEETRYPVGLYLKLEDGANNNNDTELRYSTQSLNLWGGALSADPPITVLSLPIRLEIPPLPAQAGDQSEVEIDFSVFAYSSEGTLQPDTLDSTAPYGAPTNAHHVQNVFHPSNPRIRNFSLYAGSDDEDSDVIYSSQLNRNYEVVDVGTTTIGSKVTENGFNTVLTTQSAPMATGGATDSYQQDPDWESFHMTETDDDLLQLTVHSRTLMQGVPQQVLDLSLIKKAGARTIPYLWQRQTLSLDGTDYAIIPLSLNFELSTARVDLLGLVYDTAATYNPGGGQLPGKNLSSYGRAQSTVQATGDGVLIDNKGPEPGTGGGISAADQLKLDAITMNAAGTEISDFSVASGDAPLDADEVDDTNSGHKFATTSQLNSIAANTAALTDIQAVFKESTTGDGAGVYINTSATDESHVSVTSTAGKLQAGARTAVELSETSPGSINLNVQAGATGSEAQVTAMTISGSSTVNTKATVNFPGGDFRVSSPAQFSQNVAFSGGSNTITFTAGTSGIDYNDLDNLPTIGSGSASEALYVIDSSGGTDNVTSTASTLTLDSTQFISNASNFTVTQNVVIVNMNMRACIAFYVGFKDPNGADRSEGEAFLERSTDGGSTWSLVTGSNSFAYLRNGGNNDQDTATSGNIIMAVSSGDRFRVRVKTTGATLTTSTVANMSGFSIFDLLGGATGATGPAGADGADGADGSDALALGGNDQTLTGNRVIELDGNYLQVKDSGTVRLQYDPNDNRFEFFNGLYVSGELLTATGGMTSGLIKFNEPQMGGTNGVILRGPTTNLTSDLTFTLPDADGSNGQVLQTDGSGNLSFATVSGGGGGGMTQTPFFQISGRVQWSSSFAGKRMTLGNTSYGPFNWYLHSQIVNGAAQTYNAADAVDTTTKTMANYYIYNAGAAMPSDSKKVRVKFAGRFNNQIANGSGTVGFSVWHCANMSSGSYATGDTIRLIAKSADITPTTSSLVVWEEEFVSSTAYSGGRIMIFCEHRSGTLSSTAYCYGNWSVFLES